MSVNPGAGRVRPMRWWDLEAVLQVEGELFGTGAWTAETFWSELAAQGRYYLVAEAGDPVRLQGYGGLTIGASEADVQTLAVAPHAQGRGWGGRLLHELLARAVGKRAGAVLLEVRSDNPAAIALYRRYGFEQISVRRRYYQPGDVDALVLRLRPVRLPG